MPPDRNLRGSFPPLEKSMNTIDVVVKELKDLRKHLDSNFPSKNDLKNDLKGFATKDDLKGFATKDDLKGFATKDDLKGFATKNDLKGFATKDDLKGFATKDDLKGFATKDRFDRLVLEVVKNSEDIVQIKTVMVEVRDIVKRQSEVMDDYARDAKFVFQNDRIHDGKFKDHEKRISALESRS